MIAKLRRPVARAVAIWRVRRGYAQRICAPGQWLVWRDGSAVRAIDL